MVAQIYGAADRAYMVEPVAVQAANYTLAANQLAPMDATGAARTATLPTAPPDGTVACVKKVAGTNSVTVATGAGDVFNVAGGPTTWTLSLVGQGVVVQYSASAAIWYILGDAGNGAVTGNFSASGNGSFGGTLNVTGKTTFGDQISINSSDASGSIFINQSVNTSGNPGTISQQESAATSSAYAIFVSGDGHARFVLGADGKFRWGPGNASLDTTLARTAVGGLTLTGNAGLMLSGASNSGLLFVQNTTSVTAGADLLFNEAASGSIAIGIAVTGDASNRWVIDASGNASWGPGTAGRDTTLGRVSAGVLGVTTGSFAVSTVGQGLRVKEGTNGKQGTATLAAGTVTVANTSVTSSSRIFVGTATPGGTVGAPFVSSVTVGTGFTIKSTSSTDTSTVAYEIFEPA